MAIEGETGRSRGALCHGDHCHSVDSAHRGVARCPRRAAQPGDSGPLRLSPRRARATGSTTVRWRISPASAATERRPPAVLPCPSWLYQAQPRPERRLRDIGSSSLQKNTGPTAESAAVSAQARDAGSCRFGPPTATIAGSSCTSSTLAAKRAAPTSCGAAKSEARRTRWSSPPPSSSSRAIGGRRPTTLHWQHARPRPRY
jgi:hypothetical protein